MTRIDYHNFTLVEALADVDRVVSRVRMSSKPETVEFITGHGIIRVELLNLLRNYGLNPSISIGNTGTIFCEIE